MENIVINYLILYVTGKFSKCKTSSLRLLIGSSIGALFVVLMLIMPHMAFYTTLFAKLALSCVIIAVAFQIDRLGAFFRSLAVFYMITFMFAGAGFAILYLNRSGDILFNGILLAFMPLSGARWSEIFYALVLTFILVKIFKERVIDRIRRERLLVHVVIAYNKKAVALCGLVDTGNSLRDPLTDMPVIVAEFNAIRDILPEEIRNIFDNKKDDNLEEMTKAVSSSDLLSRFRLIPFTSLGKENGMLVGFKPDYIEIENDNETKDINDVIVGIHNRTLSKNEKYKALLNPELI